MWQKRQHVLCLLRGQMYRGQYIDSPAVFGMLRRLRIVQLKSGLVDLACDTRINSTVHAGMQRLHVFIWKICAGEKRTQWLLHVQHIELVQTSFE